MLYGGALSIKRFSKSAAFLLIRTRQRRRICRRWRSFTLRLCVSHLLHPLFSDLNMGGNRLVQRPSSHIWSASDTAAARAIPDGNLVLYSLSSLSSPKRHTLPPKPTALCLRPSDAPKSHPPYIAATQTGQILLPRHIATLSASVASVDYLPEVAVAVTASELAVFDPTSKALLATHNIRHASPLTCVALISQTHAVVASQLLSLVDLNTGAILRTYTGHKTPISVAARLPEQRLVTAASDKFLSVWDVNPNNNPPSRKRRRKTSSTPHHTLIAPAPITALAVDNTDQEAITIAAVCTSSCVAIWRNYTHSTQPATPSLVVRTKEQSPEPSIFTSTFAKPRVLSLLYGNPFDPSLHSVDIEADSDLVLPPVSHHILANGANVKPVDDAQAKLDFVEKSVALESSHLRAAPERRKPNGVLRGGPSEEDGTLDQDEEEEDLNAEPTLQDKLAALGVSKPDGDTDADELSVGVSRPQSFLEPTRIDSRASVLLQAIRSKDSQLFDTCIRNTDDQAIVQRTLELIPASVATTDLFNMLTNRLQRYPRRAQNLIVWIREILMCHASAFIGQERHPALETILTVIDSRTRAFEAMMRLEGRLELIVGQATRIQHFENTDLENAVPRAKYTEKAEPQEASSDESDSDESSGEDERMATAQTAEEPVEEGETGDSSDSEENSGEEDSDEEMAEAGENGSMSIGKTAAAGHLKMNGGAGSNSDDSDDADPTI